MMKEWIKDNATMIVTYGYITLCAIGNIGAWTEIIRGIRNERKKKHKTQHERIPDAEGVLSAKTHAGRKRSSTVRFGKKAKCQNRS